jgi:hypothetical protein
MSGQESGVIARVAGQKTGQAFALGSDSWINERDRRNEASRQKAIARAIAQVSLDPCTWKK